MHHDFLIGDDEDDYLRELAWLDAQDEMGYKMWLEQQSKIKAITKVEIREEKPEIILDGVENKH